MTISSKEIALFAKHNLIKSKIKAFPRKHFKDNCITPDSVFEVYISLSWIHWLEEVSFNKQMLSESTQLTAPKALRA